VLETAYHSDCSCFRILMNSWLILEATELKSLVRLFLNKFDYKFRMLYLHRKVHFQVFSALPLWMQFRMQHSLTESSFCFSISSMLVQNLQVLLLYFALRTIFQYPCIHWQSSHDFDLRPNYNIKDRIDIGCQLHHNITSLSKWMQKFDK